MFKSVVFLLACVALSVGAFAPPRMTRTATAGSMAKYNTMDEVLALFPEDEPVLINFYDAATEQEIKPDIMRAKKLLEGKARLVSMKQQDYPEIAKLWDADKVSPSMILFMDGSPAMRMNGQSFYLDIVSKVKKYVDDEL